MSTQQQYITTNMRFPQDLYLSLKTEALHKRMSFTALVHQKLTKKRSSVSNSRISRIMADMKKVAKENAKYMKGVNLTQSVIDMRYEQ